jgi:hypothetical protein
MGRSGPKRLFGQLLNWPIRTESRGFRAYVVEPRRYDPATHADIYRETINTLTSPAAQQLDSYDSLVRRSLFERFDLVTFPEAFLPADALVESLGLISQLGDFGCVHVGLRPSASDQTHLFSVRALDSLTQRLLEIVRDHRDLASFVRWLKRQPEHHRFNVGCVFVLDAKRKLRVCLYPKMVRSKFEVSPLEEHTMTEADVLTLITLVPADKGFLSVTLQPLLCSDALDQPTESPGQLPLDCANRRADCFRKTPPDHIDLVTVANCTPQPEFERDGSPHRKWHRAFLSTFERMGYGGTLPRHYHSVVVLANFRSVRLAASAAGGGLSGVFIPVPHQRDAAHPSYLQVSSFGRKRQKDEDNDWSPPRNGVDPERETRGYIVHLDPYETDPCEVALLGFKITRFPRDNPRWGPQAGLEAFQLYTASHDPTSPTGLKYKRRT